MLPTTPGPECSPKYHLDATRGRPTHGLGRLSDQVPPMSLKTSSSSSSCAVRVWFFLHPVSTLVPGIESSSPTHTFLRSSGTVTARIYAHIPSPRPSLAHTSRLSSSQKRRREVHLAAIKTTQYPPWGTPHYPLPPPQLPLLKAHIRSIYPLKSRSRQP